MPDRVLRHSLRCRFHALLEVTGITFSENKVHALAYALFGFLRDKPDLFPGWQDL